MKLNKIYKILGLDLYSELEIRDLKSTNEATSNDITFFSDKKYLKGLENTKAAAVLISKEFVSFVPKECKVIEVKNPYLAMALISKHFAKDLFLEDGTDLIVGNNSKIFENTHVGKNVVIGSNVVIMPGCFIGDGVSIDDNTLLYPNVVVYNYTSIGANVIIHAGSIIGSDGFGFAHTATGEHIKIYHNGKVVIEDSVEIGANVTVDRAVFGTTTIKKGAKLDNLIQVAHNCEIGQHSLMAAQVGLAGSTKLGRNVVMGGQSATAGHLEICDFVTIAGKSGVTKSIKEKGTYAGFPHMPHRLWLKIQVKLAKLLKTK